MLPLPYFTSKEVAIHNKPNDIWVIVNTRIYNLTPLVHEYGLDSALIKALVIYAGKDMSHWFDRETENYLCYTHMTSGEKLPFVPHGLIPHIGSDQVVKEVWWQDPKLQVGILTERVRHVRIINMLTGLTIILETCCEDTGARIKERYTSLGVSIPADAYTWIVRSTGLPLYDNATLADSSVPDESYKFQELSLPCDLHIPALLLYYNDVITEPLNLNKLQ